MRALRRALTSVTQADGYITDAASSQNGEGVAYWLARQARAKQSLATSAGDLSAIGCQL